MKPQGKAWASRKEMKRSVSFTTMALSGAVAVLLAPRAAALILTGPAGGAATYMNYPGFFGETEARAERYEIQIATNSTFATVVDTDFIAYANVDPH